MLIDFFFTDNQIKVSALFFFDHKTKLTKN